MDQIYQLLEDIITLAEAQQGFFEVEASVLVRRSGGAEFSFIRMQLDASDFANHKVTTENTGSPPPDWF